MPALVATGGDRLQEHHLAELEPGILHDQRRVELRDGIDALGREGGHRLVVVRERLMLADFRVSVTVRSTEVPSVTPMRMPGLSRSDQAVAVWSGRTRAPAA